MGKLLPEGGDNGMVRAYEPADGNAPQSLADTLGRAGGWLARRAQSGGPGAVAPDAAGTTAEEAAEPLAFERMLLALRLTFVGVAVLPLIAFGWQAAPYGALIALAALASTLMIVTLARQRPAALLRHQLALRVLDCALVLLVLENYHGFLGNAYYDAVYVLFVVAAAATHGRRGALFMAVVASSFVLLGRLWLIGSGALQPEPRHLTDTGFYLVFFAMTGLAVAYLMRRSQAIVERRERMWRAVLEQMPASVAIAQAPHGQILLGNEQVEQLLGHALLPAGDVQGYGQPMLFHAGGLPYAPDDVPLARAIRSGETVEAEEMEARRLDGSRLTLQVSAAPIPGRAGSHHGRGGDVPRRDVAEADGGGAALPRRRRKAACPGRSSTRPR